MLVLPEEYALQAEAIVVPVRDSECSANALETACGGAAKRRKRLLRGSGHLSIPGAVQRVGVKTSLNADERVAIIRGVSAGRGR